MSLRPPRVIFVHSGPRDIRSRGPILQSLWERLPGPRPQAQPAWPSAGLSQGQMTSFSVAWSPRAPGPGSSESIRQAPLPIGTSILIWKKLQTQEQSSVWRRLHKGERPTAGRLGQISGSFWGLLLQRFIEEPWSETGFSGTTPVSETQAHSLSSKELAHVLSRVSSKLRGLC